MAAHKLSQEQMGVKLGRSGAAINQYLSRKYKGSVENLEKAFREFLAQGRARPLQRRSRRSRTSWMRAISQRAFLRMFTSASASPKSTARW